MNRTRAIAIAVILVALVASFAVHRGLQATLKLTLVPSDATVRTDTNQVVKSGTKLNAGDYLLTITRQDFDTKTIKVTLKAGQTYSATVAMSTHSAAGLKWIADHPGQAATADGIASKQADNIASSNAKTYPITNVLPQFAQRPLWWRIDYGKSAKYPTDASKIALYITADGEPAQQAALTWMKDNGFSPTDYEIIYQSIATYTAQVNSGESSQNLRGE